MRLLFIICSFLILPAVALADCEIRLLESCRIKTPEITLGDISVVKVADSNLKERLQGLVLADSPNIGQKRVISSYRVRSLLSQEGLEDVKVLGLHSTVNLESRAVSQQEIQDILDAWIAQQASSGADLDVRFLSLADGWELPLFEGMEIRVRDGQNLRSGMNSVVICAELDGRVLSTERCRLRASLSQEVPILVRDIARGESISEQDLQMKRMDLGDLAPNSLKNVDEIAGLVAKRNLKSGKPVSAQQIDQPVIIPKGSLVRVLIQNGNIRMSLAGARALRDGKRGEMISLSNPMNQKGPITAKVVRPGLALVELK